MFGKDARVVELSGEGYFDVTHSGIPFIVKSKSMDVRVLGTTFNMTAYPEDPVVTTTLLTGKVAVTCHSQTEHDNTDNRADPRCKPDSNRGKACCKWIPWTWKSKQLGAEANLHSKMSIWVAS